MGLSKKPLTTTHRMCPVCRAPVKKDLFCMTCYVKQKREQQQKAKE